ncbi:MAG: NAD-dependent epimerase/dehydratase family protein [Anaerolineae bacterium]
MLNLVTGATSFVGSHLVEALLLRGEHVHALVRPTSNTHLLRDFGAEIHIGNLNDQATLMSAAEGVDRIWHCAALTNDWGPPDAYVLTNVDGVRNMLAVATRAKVKRFIFLSTCDVYGFPGKTTLETEKPAPRGFPYVDTKIEGEMLVRNHFLKVGLPVTIVRPGTVYGPRSTTLVLPLAKALLERRGFLIDGGRHLAGLTYIGNLIPAMLLAGDVPEAIGEAYNITDGSAVTWAQFVHALADALHMPHPERNYQHWEAYALATLLESYYSLQGKVERPWLTRSAVELMGTEQDFPIEKARAQLNYRPCVPFADGLKATIAWLRQAGHVELETDAWTSGADQ